MSARAARWTPRCDETVADLPFADRLTPTADLAGLLGDQIELVRADGVALTEPAGAPSAFVECALSRVSVTGAALARCRFTGTWWRAAELTAADLSQTDWIDVQVHASRLTAVQLHDANLRRVVFYGCKLDTVNLRSATLTDVDFVDCELTDVDLGGATLRHLRFPGSTVSLSLRGCRMTGVDLTGGKQVRITDGLAALGGVVLTRTQALDLAVPLLLATGATVR